MALKFQPPSGPVAKTREESLLEPITQAVQTLPALYAQYKLQRMQQDLALKEQQMKQKEFESKYGTGVAENIAPGRVISAPPASAGPEEQMFGFEATPPEISEETPEQKMRRIGTEGYNAETARLKAEKETPSMPKPRGQTSKGFNVLFYPDKASFVVAETGEPYNSEVHGTIRLPNDPNQTNEGIRREGLVKGAMDSIAVVRAKMTPEVLNALKAVKVFSGTEQAIKNSDAKEVLNNLRTAIENQLYIKTGAAATKEETENALRKFLAGLRDEPEDFQNRINLLERDVSVFSKNPKASSPAPSPSPVQSGPKPGAIEDGYRFKGGNPASPSSWEKI